MMTYGLLAAAAIGVLAKWAFFWLCKKKAMTPRQMDAALLERLNGTGGAHAD